MCINEIRANQSLLTKSRYLQSWEPRVSCRTPSCEVHSSPSSSRERSLTDRLLLAPGVSRQSDPSPRRVCCIPRPAFFSCCHKQSGAPWNVSFACIGLQKKDCINIRASGIAVTYRYLVTCRDDFHAGYFHYGFLITDFYVVPRGARSSTVVYFAK